MNIIKLFEEFSDEYYQDATEPKINYIYSRDIPNPYYKPSTLTKIKKFFGKKDTDPNRNMRLMDIDLSNQENFTDNEIKEIKKYLPNIDFKKKNTFFWDYIK